MKEAIIRLTSDHIKVKGAEYVQDLVRCKECKAHHDANENPAHIMCGYMSADDFCSYGERKESE